MWEVDGLIFLDKMLSTSRLSKLPSPPKIHLCVTFTFCEETKASIYTYALPLQPQSRLHWDICWDFLFSNMSECRILCRRLRLLLDQVQGVCVHWVADRAQLLSFLMKKCFSCSPRPPTCTRRASLLLRRRIEIQNVLLLAVAPWSWLTLYFYILWEILGRFLRLWHSTEALA